METLVQILFTVFMAGAVYGGIRADIKAIHADLYQQRRRTDRLEQRIDKHLDNPK